MDSSGILKRSYFLLFISIILAVPAMSQNRTTERVGWWNFNNTTNLLAPVPGYGQALELIGSHQQVQGPATNDFAAKIGPGSYYKMTHNIAANGGGSFVNEYSLQIDFKVETTDVWHCFFQTSPANANDGDCFINPGGKIGVAATGYAATAIQPNEWYRLIITVDNGTLYNYYIDGYNLFTGNIQDVDGRFALDDILLMFADEDGEDNNIIVSEIGIWDRPLSALEVHYAGGFGHMLNVSPYFIAYPFLQTLTSNSVYVCWHDTLTNSTRVEYGLTQALGSVTSGTSELLAPMYRWHTVKLTSLTPDTKYYYRIDSGSDTSAIYNFRTQPGDDYTGHLRFLIFSDTQDDSTATGKVVRSARNKVQELFGSSISDNINLITHTGDIVGNGNVISYWTDQFMRPFSSLTPYIPYLSVAGNHEGESQYYYTYVKYDDISAYPPTHDLFEKIWTYRLPRVLFIGLNTNVISAYGETQRLWLDSKLAEAESDTTIDFVFCFLHHPPVSEIWGEGNTPYVENDILNVLKKYSKVQQLSYGHTHAYEMGTVESVAENSKGDFRISCVGGGGGNRDRWGEYTNFDYPQIHKALDHYFYVLFDIDLATKSYTGTMYDLGNEDYPLNNVASDTWHRKLNQPAPDKPTALNPTYSGEGNLVLHAGNFTGIDELMTSQFQVTGNPGDYSNLLFSSTRNWQDIYGVDASFNPVDLNAGIDLTALEIPSGTLHSDSSYAYRARYRDQNLKWSEWSDELPFYFTDTTGMQEYSYMDSRFLNASPNPCSVATEISFTIPTDSKVEIDIYDLPGNKVRELVNREMIKGSYTAPFETKNLHPGIYLCKLHTKNGDYLVKLVISG